MNNQALQTNLGPISSTPKCDIILTQEEYELILRKRALDHVARRYEQQKTLQRRLTHRSAPRRPSF